MALNGKDVLHDLGRISVQPEFQGKPEYMLAIDLKDQTDEYARVGLDPLVNDRFLWRAGRQSTVIADEIEMLLSQRS